MIATVNFYYQLFFNEQEIGNIVTDDVLSEHLMFTKMFPKYFLSIRGMLPILPRELFQ